MQQVVLMSQVVAELRNSHTLQQPLTDLQLIAEQQSCATKVHIKFVVCHQP